MVACCCNYLARLRACATPRRPEARNKTFDVCYELPSDAGSSMYELVTSAPDKKGRYLAQAATVLAKNT